MLGFSVSCSCLCFFGLAINSWLLCVLFVLSHVLYLNTWRASEQSTPEHAKKRNVSTLAPQWLSQPGEIFRDLGRRGNSAGFGDICAKEKNPLTMCLFTWQVGSFGSSPSLLWGKRTSRIESSYCNTEGKPIPRVTKAILIVMMGGLQTGRWQTERPPMRHVLTTQTLLPKNQDF